MPEYARKLNALLDSSGLSQTALADLLSVGQSTVSYYLSGRKRPGKFPCLVLAGLSKNEADRSFWIRTAGLKKGQRESLLRGLSGSSGQDDPKEAKVVSVFLDFWRHPAGNLLPHIKEMLKVTVFLDYPDLH